MFAYRVDRAFGVCVWVFAGRTNTDRDFQRYVDSFPALDEVLSSQPLVPLGLHYVAAENPMPGPKWRRRFAEASRDIRCKPVLAFVSRSPLVRGIVTAVNWFRPPPYEFEIFSTFERGVAFLEDRRREPLPRLEELFDECARELNVTLRGPES